MENREKEKDVSENKKRKRKRRCIVMIGMTIVGKKIWQITLARINESMYVRTYVHGVKVHIKE